MAISLNENSKRISVDGHTGTWYVTDTQTVDNKQYFLLEHETYGDEAAGVIVDTNGNLILDDVYNGFDDLSNFFDVETNISEDKMAIATIYYSDESINYYNEEIFINAVKENFNTLGVNGWNIEFISASPALRKTIEDIKCSEFGYSNPYDLENYIKNDFNFVPEARQAKMLAFWKEEQITHNDNWRDNYVISDADKTLVAKWDNIAPRLFVDMDGTLAVFKQVDTLETLYEKGYFANLSPQVNVVNAIKILNTSADNVEVFVLSSVLQDSKFAIPEKNEWLDKNLPEIDSSHRIFVPCGADKKDFVPGGIRSNDYLLDDYSTNLHSWEPPAIGIKLLNGINGTKGTWQGDKVSFALPANEISDAIGQMMGATNKIEHMVNYGYEFDNTNYMIPLSKETALKLFEEQPILLLYQDNSESYADNLSDIENHYNIGGICGVEMKDNFITEQQGVEITSVPLPDGYHQILEHNNMVLAEKQLSGSLTNYAVWNIDNNRGGVWGGSYFMDNKNGAFACFAIKSDMLNGNTVFAKDELVTIYKCLQDTYNADYVITPADEDAIKAIGIKIEQAVPGLLSEHVQALPKVQQLGTLKQHPDVPLIKYNDNVYALGGWNGEKYTDCWKYESDQYSDSSKQHCEAKPIYKYQKDNVSLDTVEENSQEWDELCETVDYEITVTYCNQQQNNTITEEVEEMEI